MVTTATIHQYQGLLLNGTPNVHGFSSHCSLQNFSLERKSLQRHLLQRQTLQKNRCKGIRFNGMQSFAHPSEVLKRQTVGDANESALTHNLTLIIPALSHRRSDRLGCSIRGGVYSTLICACRCVFYTISRF